MSVPKNNLADILKRKANSHVDTALPFTPPSRTNSGVRLLPKLPLLLMSPFRSRNLNLQRPRHRETPFVSVDVFFICYFAMSLKEIC